MKYFLLAVFCFISINTFAQTTKRNFSPLLNRSTERSLSKFQDENYPLLQDFPAGLNKNINSYENIDSIYNIRLNNKGSKIIFTKKENKIFSILTEFYTFDYWDKVFKDEYHYDQEGLIDTILYYFNYTTISENWVITNRARLIYNSKKNLKEKYLESFLDNKWSVDLKYSYDYNENNNRSSLYTYYLRNDIWDCYDKYFYHYNTDGYLDQIESFSLNNGIWKNNSRIYYYPDSFGKSTMRLCKKWHGNGWIDEYSEYYFFDSDGNKRQSIFKYFDGSNWVPQSRFNFTYNENNNYIYGLCEEWQDSCWVKADGSFDVDFFNSYNLSANACEQFLYFSNPTSVKKEDLHNLDYILSQNYPNPFNPVTNIKYSLPKDGFVTLKVYNVLGQEVSALVNEFKNKGEYEVQFNASNLSSGVYFYNLKAGNISISRKITVQK